MEEAVPERASERSGPADPACPGGDDGLTRARGRVRRGAGATRRAAEQRLRSPAGRSSGGDRSRRRAASSEWRSREAEADADGEESATADEGGRPDRAQRGIEAASRGAAEPEAPVKHADVIAFANQKGGVAKTTTTLNLAVAFAESGHRVLCIDLDPQGNLTMSQGIDPDKVENSLYDVLVNDMPISEIIQTARSTSPSPRSTWPAPRSR